MRGTALILTALLAAPAWAQDAPNLAREMPPAGKVTVAKAIEGGVRYLVKIQNKSGSFGKPTVGRTWEIMANVPGSLHAFRAATTALCWMGPRDVSYRTPESEAARISRSRRISAPPRVGAA